MPSLAGRKRDLSARSTRMSHNRLSPHFEIGRKRSTAARHGGAGSRIRKAPALSSSILWKACTGRPSGSSWGVAHLSRQPGEGTAAGEAGEGGLKAAWDDIEEATDADLDALLSEDPQRLIQTWRSFGGPIHRLGSGLARSAGRP